MSVRSSCQALFFRQICVLVLWEEWAQQSACIVCNSDKFRSLGVIMCSAREIRTQEFFSVFVVVVVFVVRFGFLEYVVRFSFIFVTYKYTKYTPCVQVCVQMMRGQYNASHTLAITSNWTVHMIVPFTNSIITIKHHLIRVAITSYWQHCNCHCANDDFGVWNGLFFKKTIIICDVRFCSTILCYCWFYAHIYFTVFVLAWVARIFQHYALNIELFTFHNSVINKSTIEISIYDWFCRLMTTDLCRCAVVSESMTKTIIPTKQFDKRDRLCYEKNHNKSDDIGKKNMQLRTSKSDWERKQLIRFSLTNSWACNAVLYIRYKHWSL